MKDGTTHLAYKPEHAVDLDTGAVVAAEANLGAMDRAATAVDSAECLANKGYHSRAVLEALDDSRWKTPISEPKQNGFSRWRGDEARGHQQPRASQVRGRPRGLQAAFRDCRALLCPQPRSRRHAPNLAAQARERAQAVPASYRRPQSLIAEAQLSGAGTPREAVVSGYDSIFVLITPTGTVLVAQIVLIVSEDG